MASEINDLPPPWPNQALAQARKAHSIPMTDANLKASADNESNSGAKNSSNPDTSEGAKRVNISA